MKLKRTICNKHIFLATITLLYIILSYFFRQLRIWTVGDLDIFLLIFNLTASIAILVYAKTKSIPLLKKASKKYYLLCIPLVVYAVFLNLAPFGNEFLFYVFALKIIDIMVSVLLQELFFRVYSLSKFIDKDGINDVNFIILIILCAGSDIFAYIYKDFLSASLTILVTASIGAVCTATYLKTNNILMSATPHFAYHFISLLIRNLSFDGDSCRYFAPFSWKLPTIWFYVINLLFCAILLALAICIYRSYRDETNIVFI